MSCTLGGMSQATEETPEVHKFPIGAAPEDGQPDERHQISMKAPTPGQLLVLTRIVDLAEEEPLEAVQLFGDAIESMVENRSDVRWMHKALLRGEIEPDHLAELARDVLTHFMPEQGNRAERRANGTKRSRARAR